MLGYIIVSVISIILGQAVKHLNLKMPPVVSEEITYKEYYSTLFKDFKIDIKYSFILLCFSNVLMYLLGNVYSTYIYIVLFAILLIVFSIDYRFQLIPDESHIVIIVLAIINACFNTDKILDYFLGGLIGGGIFLLISGLALLIYKKEGMGFGDVKLMASLGLLFRN